MTNSTYRVRRLMIVCWCPILALKNESRWLIFAAVILLANAPSFASELVTVNANSGPWQWVNAGLNTGDQYGYDNEQPPTVVAANALNGIPFTTADVLTISYVSGGISPNASALGVYPYTDANGESSLIADSGDYAAIYVPSVEYPTYLCEVLGVFTNSNGAIVGEPQVVGDTRSLIIPAGATQFQLGCNDDNYSDNGGSVSMEITEAVPEPSSILLLAISGVVGVVRLRWRKPFA